MKLRMSMAPMAVALVGAGIAVTPVAAGTVPKYAFAPAPIAPAGSLAANASVPVTLTTEDSTGAPAANAPVWLSFTPTTGGGSAAVGTTPLTTSPAMFTSDTSAHVAITYTAPGTLPASGTDTIKAQDNGTHPSTSKSDSYNFASKAATLARYKWSPSPIAKPDSLKAGASVNATVSAVTASGTGISGATIYLSQSGTPIGTASVGTTPLTSTPTAFLGNGSGQVVVTYTAPATLPSPATGTDTVVAQNAAASPTVSASDSYSYGRAAHYALTPTPIAPSASLAANTPVTVTLTVTDASSNPVAGASVQLSFIQGSGGGIARVGTKDLSATAAGFTTDGAGQITITYVTPGTLPSGGTTDTIDAANKTTSPTITASDSYTF